MPPQKKKARKISTTTKLLVEKRVNSLLNGEKKSLAQLGVEVGYNPANAEKSAARALSSKTASEYVESRVLGKLKANTDEVLHLLASHLRADIGDFGEDVFKDDGSLDMPLLKKRGLSRVIKEIDTDVSYDKDGNKHIKTKFKLHSSLEAAKLLIPVLKMVQPAPTVNVHLNVNPEDVAWARERLEFYRGQGLEDEQIIDLVPEVAEMAQLSSPAIQ